jgi:hypothetical protein
MNNVLGLECAGLFGRAYISLESGFFFFFFFFFEKKKKNPIIYPYLKILF